MSLRRLLRPSEIWWLLAVLALAFMFAYPMQVNGYNQNSHYALVRSLAVHGVPNIDQSRNEIGEVSTGDAARYHGHWYSAKAPGLAFVTIPAFLVTEAVGMRTVGDPTRVIWALHLWSIALTAVLLVLLMRRVGDRLEAGFGAPTALVLGLATLVLPFATLFFSHVLAAALAFTAFAVLLHERSGLPRLSLVALGGLLAGFAFVVEFPLLLAGGILGVYALARTQPVRRAVAYTGGGVVGALPLFAFNWWAFGNPFHSAYEEYYKAPGLRSAGHGIFGFGLPSIHSAADILFSSMGVVTLTPVVVCGVAGGVLLLRSRRAEAFVVLGIVATYLVYNSSLRYESPFGGLGPPRYLLPAMPFVAVPLVAAFRAFPLTTIALALVSAFQMVVMTATGPLAAYDGEWLQRARAHEFVQTGASIVGVTGWYSIVPFFVAALLAIVFAGRLAARPPVVRRLDLITAGAGLLAWAAVALAASNPNGQPPSASYVAAAIVAVGGLTLAFAVLSGGLPGRRPSLRPLRSPR